MKLASVQKITSIDPIENADAIEVASVLGWRVVVKKNEFKVGDLVGYIQIDTKVPETDQFEFLRPRDFRVRTIKLRGQISQGLIVPLPTGKWKEDDDLTKELGVIKYVKDGETAHEEVRKVGKNFITKLYYKIKYKYVYKWFPGLRKVSKKPFPTELVSRTDEERVQNIPWVFEKYKNKLFIGTEKLDGSSITIIREKKNKYRVCSRNWEMVNPNNEWTRVFNDTNFKVHIENLFHFFETNNIIVQGEYIGKPQGNYYELSNQIRLFNIIVDGKRLNPLDFNYTVKSLGIPSVPLLGDFYLDGDLSSLLKRSEGKSELNNKKEREGIVLRCIEDGFSFKVISNKFLIKNNE